MNTTDKVQRIREIQQELLDLSKEVDDTIESKLASELMEDAVSTLGNSVLFLNSSQAVA